MSDSKKKILIVSTSLGQGGAERASAVQSIMFSQLGYDVYLVTILSDVSYKYSGTLINLGELKNKDDSVFGRLKRLFKFRRLLKEHDFSLIVDNRARNQWYRELIIGKLVYNCPVVYMIHSCDKNVAFTPYYILNRLLYAQANMVSVSQGVTDQFKNLYRLENIRTIHNGFDFDAIVKQSNESPNAIPKERYILYYGRLHDYSKNLKLLLEAYSASKLSNENIRLFILGDGPDKKMLQDFSISLGLDDFVVFKPFRANPFPLVKHAYYTVLTSRSEGFALTLIESLSLETPVISVACNAGPKEIIRHEDNGLLVENHNVDALAMGMRRLVNDHELYQHCKINAKKSTERFQLKNLVNDWQQLLEEVII